jgi:drug/metabolite transporter (DMT)-like permease
MCLFKLLTGMPCPGCGMTRAYLHLFKGDLAGAFYFHPLFWLIPPLLLLVIFWKKPVVQRINRNRYFWLALIVVVCGVYGYRMWHLFPQQAPLDFDPNGLIPRLFTSITTLFA